MIPQIIMIFLAVLALGLGMHRHGKPRMGTYDFRDELIAVAISQGLLIWGGFYGVFS